MASKKTIYMLLVFFCSLAWFVWNGGWYPQSKLFIQGFVPDADTAIVVEWDSGSGLNRYEREDFHFDTVQHAGDSMHEIVLRNTGKRNRASKGEKIVCSAVSIDGREQDLRDLVPESDKLRGGKIRLDRKGSEVRFSSRATKNIHIEMLTDSRSGIAEVGVDGHGAQYDLYMKNIEAKKIQIDRWVVGENDGFTIWMDIPRYRINSLIVRSKNKNNVRFTDVRIVSESGSRSMLSGTEPTDNVKIVQIRNRSKHYFHSVQFAVQSAFAALTTWIIFALIRLAGQYKSAKDIFFAGGRPVFWSLLLASVLCYSLWLAAFWPGVMSVDSLKIWRAAKLPDVFINDHPLFNIILYMFLMQIWNNVVIVPITHILLVSLLSASIFFWLYKRGIALYWLLPFYFLLLFSIPVGLYNLMLWKDIPFALLIVFWGYTMVRLYEMRKKGGELSFQYGLALVFLWLALSLTRHNGIIYLAYIPLLFLLLGFFNLKKVAAVLGVLLVMGGLLFFLARSTGYISDANYLVSRGNFFVKQMVHKGIGQRAKNAGRNYLGILDINQKRSQWDLFHYYLRDRSAYWFLTRSGWNDTYPYLPGPSDRIKRLRETALQVYNASYIAPWVFFTWNPVYMLILFPLTLIFFPFLPRSALYSSMFLIQVAALLVIVNVLNWRYYYFIYLGAYFLFPMILLDFSSLREQRQQRQGGNAF